MARYKKSDFKPALDEINELPADRREEIFSGAAEVIAKLRLAELRKAMDVTQVGLSKKSGINQAEVSRIENRPETVQLRTMERYVKSLGGSLKIVAEFPDGTVAQIPLRAGKPVKSKITAEKPVLRGAKGRSAA